MRPVLLFVCHPLTGHMTPVLRVAGALRQRGWRVAYLSSEFFRARIEAADLQFLPLQGAADLDDDKLFDRGSADAEKEEMAGWVSASEAERLPQSITDLRHQTLAALPAEWESLKAALARLAEQWPGERLMVISEAFYYGAMPLKLGAALPPAVAAQLIPHTICLSITAPCIRSIDLPPFGWPEPFDPSPAGRQRNAQLWLGWLERAAPLTRLLRRKLYEAGVPAGRGVDDMVFLGGANYTCHDAIGLIGIPAFEFPRSDFPPNFEIVGIVPPSIPARRPPFPWWDELEQNGKPGEERGSGEGNGDKKRKKVVVVAQGTVETEPTELIVPTLRLLGERPDDVLTVAILGRRGARLSGTLADNARVADYLAYDAVLPYADLWVHNGGYGATMHGIAHGVPMVIAGDGQDKPENGKRVQYSGLGIDLATAHPEPARLQEAMERVLAEPRFAETARAMQQTSREMDCFATIERMIVKRADM